MGLLCSASPLLIVLLSPQNPLKPHLYLYPTHTLLLAPLLSYTLSSRPVLSSLMTFRITSSGLFLQSLWLLASAARAQARPKPSRQGAEAYKRQIQRNSNPERDTSTSRGWEGNRAGDNGPNCSRASGGRYLTGRRVLGISFHNFETKSTTSDYAPIRLCRSLRVSSTGSSK
jgi:hypothetical protein